MRFLILIMTILSGSMCLFSAGLTVWYWARGVNWSALLQLAATGLTFAGTQLGIWWIRHNE